MKEIPKAKEGCMKGFMGGEIKVLISGGAPINDKVKDYLCSAFDVDGFMEGYG